MDALKVFQLAVLVEELEDSCVFIPHWWKGDDTEFSTDVAQADERSITEAAYVGDFFAVE